MQELLNIFSTIGLKGLIGLYFLTNTFRLVSYVPQIVQIYRQNDDVKAISLWTWGMWTASNFTTALYAALVLPQLDLLLVLLNLGNSLGCLSVIVLVIMKRRAYKNESFNAAKAPFDQLGKLDTEANYDDQTGVALR